MRPLHIGLLTADLAGWAGGVDLLRVIASGLAVTGHPISLLIPRNTFKHKIRDQLSYCKRLITKLRYREWPRHISLSRLDAQETIEIIASSGCDFTIIEYDNSRQGLAQSLSSNGIDVILPCLNTLGSNFPTPWVGYISDLQHKHLPRFFSREERSHRDRHFARMLRDARVAIVNSRYVATDVKCHYGDKPCRLVALPFSPMAAPSWFTIDRSAARAKYSLPSRYFVISNQLWQHKDHLTAFRACAMGVPREVQLICTGHEEDSRAPGYRDYLKKAPTDLGLDGQVRFLGYIPKQDQIAIVRDAVAVVQPTLFEGGPGGGSVYDAIAVGTHAIVSDIPVNSEITAENCTFFRAGCPQDLFEKMMTVLDRPKVRVDDAELWRESARRAERLATSLMAAISESSNWNGDS